MDLCLLIPLDCAWQREDEWHRQNGKSETRSKNQAYQWYREGLGESVAKEMKKIQVESSTKTSTRAMSHIPVSWMINLGHAGEGKVGWTKNAKRRRAVSADGRNVANGCTYRQVF